MDKSSISKRLFINQIINTNQTIMINKRHNQENSLIVETVVTKTPICYQHKK